MNLKKALEKAKELRGEDSGRPQVYPIRAPKKVQGTDWKPPVYAESSRVELDAATLVDHHCVCISPDAPELEHYKVLRTKIQHLTRSRAWRTVMITSPREAEGKTLTAVNLALTFAKAYNQTVMLVDCDLRRQGIHKMLGYERELGLVDFLLGERDLKEFITWPGIDQMTVISGGRNALNGAELLGSVRMKALVQEVKARYDDRYVLFDTAPVLPAPMPWRWPRTWIASSWWWRKAKPACAMPKRRSACCPRKSFSASCSTARGTLERRIEMA